MGKDGGGPPTGNQFEGGNFRFRNDDGTQDPFGGTWIAPLNRNIVLPLSYGQFRLRYEIIKTAGTDTQKLEFGVSLNGAAFTQVLDDGTTAVTNVSSAYVSNNEDTIPYTGDNQVYTSGNDWAMTTGNGCCITDDNFSETDAVDFDASFPNPDQSICAEICLQLETSLLTEGDHMEVLIFLDGKIAPTAGWQHRSRINIANVSHPYIVDFGRRRRFGRILSR